MSYTTGTFSKQYDLIEGAISKFIYTTSDSIATVLGAGYVTDATAKRLKVGDLVDVFSGTLISPSSGVTLGAATFPATVGVSSLFASEPTFVEMIVASISAGAATLATADSTRITDNSGGTANQTTGVVATLATQTFLIPIQLADLGTGAETLNIDPGFNGKITAANLRVIKAGAGSGATQTLTAQVAGTNVTGGVVNPTLANTTTPGAQVAGTAITALNTFTSAQAIGVNVTTGGTVFTAGDAVIELTVVNTDLANAIATLIKF